MNQKFSDEKLLEFKQAGFSAEEIMLFMNDPSYAPTDEELDALMNVQAVSDAWEGVPDDADKFTKEFDEVFGEIAKDTTLSDAEREQKIKEKAQQYPELAKQVSSLYYLDEFVFSEDEVENTENTDENENN